VTMSPNRERPGTEPTVVVAHPGAQLYGSDRMLIESVGGLLDAGWHVIVTVPTDGPLVEEVRSRGAIVQICPTPVLRKAFLNPIGILRLAGQAVTSFGVGWRLLRRHRPRAVYVNTVTIPQWLVLARLARVPSVCHVHEAEPTVASIVRRALTLPLVLAGRLILISRHCAEVAIGDWPLLRERVELVYNGVTGPPEPSHPRTSLTGPVRLLFVGRLSERKGVQDVVDALGLLHERGVDATLDLVGDAFSGHEWVKEDLIGRARRAGTIDALHLWGFDEDIWPHLASSDILVVPSRIEPFGLVVVEGALSARPVVLSRVGGMVEAADASRTAFVVEPADPAAIADAVASIIERWDEVRTWAIEDVATVAERFSMQRYRSAIAAVVARTGGWRPQPQLGQAPWCRVPAGRPVALATGAGSGSAVFALGSDPVTRPVGSTSAPPSTAVPAAAWPVVRRNSARLAKVAELAEPLAHITTHRGVDVLGRWKMSALVVMPICSAVRCLV
jgi:glycosyltransferase involved in cell wall biosynthesis